MVSILEIKMSVITDEHLKEFRSYNQLVLKTADELALTEEIAASLMLNQYRILEELRFIELHLRTR